MSYWDQFQVISPSKHVETDQPVQSEIEQKKPEEKQDFWDQFQAIETPETKMESFQRQAKGAITRGIAQVAGLPGDIESLGRSIIPGVEKEPKLPTSAKFLEARKKLHPELEPKDRKEAIAQEILGDYILQPGGPLKKLAISAAQTLAKEFTKDLGGDEKTQVGAKIVTAIMASRIGKPNVNDFIKKEYAKSSSSIPKADVVNAKRAETYLNQIESKISQGAMPKWKKEVLDQIGHLKSNIKDGKIKVTALDDVVKDINKIIPTLDPKKDGPAIMWLSRIKKGAVHELKQYGKTNPEFWNHYKTANAAFAGYKQSLIAERQIEKFKQSGLLKGSILLLGEALIHPTEALKSGSALLGLYGIKKTGELTQRIFSNPVLASYYMKTLAAAGKENAAQVISNLAKLDEGLRKENQNRHQSILKEEKEKLK